MVTSMLDFATSGEDGFPLVFATDTVDQFKLAFLEVSGWIRACVVDDSGQDICTVRGLAMACGRLFATH